MWEEFQGTEMISKEDLDEFMKEGRIRASPQLENFLRVTENANYVCESVLETLVDELCLGLVFSVHLEARLGIIESEVVVTSEQCEDGDNTDIFGEPIAQRKTHKCVCPQCKHSLAASRFAPHLAKCLGLGRISSRIASRRIASNSGGYGGGALSDDEDDADWTAGAPERRRRRRDRSGARRLKTQRLTRIAPATSTVTSTDLLQVDVDTYEEGDVQSMRESLGRSWEQEHSNTSSPADSASTSSSSSKKREKLPRVKTKNNSKNHKGSPTVLGSLPSLAD